MLFKSVDANEYLVDIADVGRQASEIFQKHFPEMEVVEEASEHAAPLETEISQVLDEVRDEIDDEK